MSFSGAHANLIAFICFPSFKSSTNYLVKSYHTEVCPLSRRIMLSVSTRDSGSIRIPSITERHSLFPLSCTRTPCRLTLRLAYPLERSGRDTGLPCSVQVTNKWVRSCLFHRQCFVRVTPKFRRLSDCLPFGSSPTSFGSLYFTMFIRQFTFVDHTIKPSPSRRLMLPAVDVPLRFGLLLKGKVTLSGQLSHKWITHYCTCP
ncbi:hypothetical protein JCM10512_5193 [Bacteroides reticulotermitis JCM 10512]|uniref:Uncharacterized protein n=1 Tax=Bacteroides reticulotermitis JCM 10512 TaxID=1445607 RepID=W4V1H9_9BACE|nr:hypothetical protein JCM10512_5193 [Bacteroides reticulotermitis JCM 10512]